MNRRWLKMKLIFNYCCTKIISTQIFRTSFECDTITILIEHFSRHRKVCAAKLSNAHFNGKSVLSPVEI